MKIFLILISFYFSLFALLTDSFSNPTYTSSQTFYSPSGTCTPPPNYPLSSVTNIFLSECTTATTYFKKYSNASLYTPIAHYNIQTVSNTWCTPNGKTSVPYGYTVDVTSVCEYKCADSTKVDIDGACVANPCTNGSVYENGQCMSCPAGYIYGDTIINGVPSRGCSACPSSQISSNNMCIPCASNQIATNNICSDCPQYAHPANNVCVNPTWSDWDNDPAACKSHGGWSQVKMGGSLFKPTVGSKCVDPSKVLDDYLALVLGWAPSVSAGALGDMAKWALDGLKNKLPFLENLGSKDLSVGLPKINIGSNGIPEIKPIIKESPTPVNNAPTVNVDPNLLNLRPEYFPPNSSGEADVSMANIDRWNRDNLASKDNNVNPVNNNYNNRTLQTDLTNRTTSAQPVSEVLEFPMIVQNPNLISNVKPVIKDYPEVFNNPSYFPAPEVPQVVSTVPVNRTVQNTVTETGLPVTRYTNDISYPDGSGLHEVIDVSPDYNRGRVTSTTTSSTGKVSQTSYNFDAPSPTSSMAPELTVGNVQLSPPDLSNPLRVTKTSPVSTTMVPLTAKASDPYTPLPIDPVTNLPVANAPISNGLPVTAQGQDLINAPMPAFSFPALSEFTPFNLSDATEIINNGTTMINNIKAQLDTAKTSFDTTKTLITGGWTAPTFPSGSCGNSLVINFRGKSTDLCPPMLNNISKISPIFSNVVAIGGMAFAVTIFIGGF